MLDDITEETLQDCSDQYFDKIQLRHYQIEIIKKAKKQNSIIFLPTGSGKTFVVMMVLRSKWKEMDSSASGGGKISVILGTTKSLVNQLAEAVQEFTEYKVKEFIGDMGIDDWSETQWRCEIVGQQVLVMTPAIFVVLLQRRLVQFDKVAVLVLDECHHATLKHPYNQVMGELRNHHSDEKPLVIGLTATVLNTSPKENVMDQVNSLKANMNCEFAQVESFREALLYGTCPRESFEAYEVNETKRELTEELIESAINHLQFLKILGARDIQAEKTVPKNDVVLNKQFTFKKEIINLFKTLSRTQTELGLYCVSLGALYYTIRLERLKCITRAESHLSVLNYAVTVLNAVRRIIHRITPEVNPLSNKELFTNKLTSLINLVRQYEDLAKEKKLTCLIFVQERVSAIILACLFNEINNIEKNDFFKSDFATGGLFNTVFDQEESRNDRRCTKLAIKRLENHECNFLFATNVAEEGIDLPACNLVIKFDSGIDFRSYIQSKGRARLKNAEYIMFGEKSVLSELKAKTQSYRNLYMSLLQVLNTEDLNSSLFENPDDEEFFFPNGPDGGYISATASVSLIVRFVSMLPQDEFSNLTPLCWYSRCTQQAFLQLPESASIKGVLQGEPKKNSKLAKKNVFLKAVKELYRIGEILPDFSLRHYKFVENDYQHLFPHLSATEDLQQDEIEAGTKKKKRQYEIQYAENLKHCLPVPGTTVYLHVIKITPKFSRPSDSRDEAFYDLFGESNFYALLTRKKHPKIFDFPLFSCMGQFECSLIVDATSVKLTAAEIEKIKTFHFFIFHTLLGVVKRLDVLHCGEDFEGYSFYIVPVKEVEINHFCINWDIINIPCNVSEVAALDELIDSNPSIENYHHSIVYPNYRQANSCMNRYYVVTSLDYSQTPMSAFPSEDFENYYTYFKKKYDVKILNKAQPLIEVKPVPSILNYLQPITSSKMLKKYQKESENYHEHLVPELCCRLVFPASYWLKATMLPSALHRIASISLVDDVRRKIVSETDLGIFNIGDDCWLPLEVDINDEKNQDSLEFSPYKKWNASLISRRQLKPMSNDSPVLNDLFRNMMKCASCDLKHYLKQFEISRSEEKIPFERLKQYPFSFQDKDEQMNPLSQEKEEELKIEYENNSRKGPELCDLLKVFTCKSTNDIFNLERFEFLGDSFLKFGVALFLYKTQNTHEGILANLKDKLVSNKNLYYCALAKNLQGALQVHEFAPKSEWEAPLFCLAEEIKLLMKNYEKAFEIDYSLEITPKEKLTGKLNQKTVDEIKMALSKNDETVVYINTEAFLSRKLVSDKSIADSIEALLGLYITSCGLRGGFRILNWLDVLPCKGGSYYDLLKNVTAVDSSGGLHHLSEVPYSILEETIGYKFNNKSLLLQALTHPSFLGLPSYQRLEFLGDAVLDFLIAIHIFNCGKRLGPGQMTDVKISLVNNVTLACLSVKHDFQKYILHQSCTLLSAINAFVSFQKDRYHKIDYAVLLLREEGECRIGESVDVPKALGDIFESLIGAIFLDSGNCLHTVWKVVHKLMKNVIDDFSRNPLMSPIRMLYEISQSFPEFSSSAFKDGSFQTVCKIYHEEKEELFWGIGRNSEQSKLSAAKLAVLFLQNSISRKRFEMAVPAFLNNQQNFYIVNKIPFSQLNRVSKQIMALQNYDREYERNLNLARRLICKIKDKSDRSIALKYMTLITTLKSDEVTVKKNRNAFFNYFLQVLEDQLNTEAKTKIQCTCPIQNEETLSDSLKYLQKEGMSSGEKTVTNWSKDKRSYLSAKILPGRGALLYMAVSSTSDEWDVRGQQKKT